MKTRCYGHPNISCSACRDYVSPCDDETKGPIVDYAGGADFLLDVEWSPSFYISVVQAAHAICKQRDAQFLFVFCPMLSHVNSPSPHEQFLRSIRFGNPNLGPNYVGNRLEYLRTCSKIHQTIFGELNTFNNEYIQDIFSDANLGRDANGLPFQEDYSSRWVNVIAGHRLTTGQSSQFDRTLHMFGASEVYGLVCEDNHTISSFLQHRFNEHHNNNTQSPIWRVQNHGVRGSRLNCNLIRIWQAGISPGDFVILFDNTISLPQKNRTHGYKLIDTRSTDMKAYSRYNIPVFDARNIFERPHNHGEIFVDRGHFSYKGNAVIADTLFNHIIHQINDRKSKTTTAVSPLQKRKPDLSGLSHPNLQIYLDFLRGKAIKPTISPCRIGATVINANPLTWGHVHLIETAAGMVDHLYVFVVEENRSFFSFDIRFKLVKAGVAHINNVSILPSGEFMVSSESFPEYFNKEACQHVRIDATRDILPFCIHIAPLLGINLRFVGEEPYCQITKQHNEQLKIICPEYEIQVIEIPRIARHDKIISASLVRRFYRDKDWKNLCQLVPQVTWDYLKQTEQL